MQEDIIYYVLPQQIGHFALVEPPTKPVQTKDLQLDTSAQAVFNALKYRYALKWLGKGSADLHVLCIPAKEHIIQRQQSLKHTIPTIVKVEEKGQLQGYLSGRRSAIFKSGDILIRYKGCGNDSQGFIQQNGQLRGSHFFHTAKRELYMTSYINETLKKSLGWRSANNPLFFYEFPVQLPSPLRNDLPLLTKYCCVFQTKGDRRAGTHLISPLEILFLNLLDIDSLPLQQFFTSRNRLDEFGITELLVDFDLSLNSGEKFLEKYDHGQQFTNYVTLQQVQKHIGKRLLVKKDATDIIAKIAEKFGKLESQRVNDLLSADWLYNWSEVVRILVERVGWEMGAVKRTFCQSSINWGFFNDHGYWHCNAHLNNFVVTPPNPEDPLLLPLDFDLAFTEDQYINIDLEAETYGLPDHDNFQQLLLSEYNAMQMSISGVQVMNFRYSIEQAEQKQPSESIRMARIIFRDTLVRSFRWGMRNDKSQQLRMESQWKLHLKSIKQLVEACLLLSSDFQT